MGGAGGGESREADIFRCPPVVCNAVLKPYFVLHVADIWGALNNMNYVLRNKLLTPLEFLQEHFNPGPEDYQDHYFLHISPTASRHGY